MPKKLVRNKMTPLAHAVRFAMRCGIVDVSELAAELDCTTSAIYRAKKLIPASESDRDVVTDTSLCDRDVKSDRTELTETSESDRDVTFEAGSASHAPASITTHGTKESSSKIVTLRKLVASNTLACEEKQIEGLNGSTSKYVGWLANWLNEWAPDLEGAHDILEANVEIYGPDKVRAGMVELKTIIAGGEKPRNLAKAFPAFIKNASTEVRAPIVPVNKVEAKYAAGMAALSRVGGVN